jgi:hypothetical protein
MVDYEVLLWICLLVPIRKWFPVLQMSQKDQSTGLEVTPQDSQNQINVPP